VTEEPRPEGGAGPAAEGPSGASRAAAAPPLSLRERQKQRRRHRIYTVAIQLFRERGFEAATATDIAKHAHVSCGTFFNYYPYKEAVLLDYGAEVIGGLAEKARQRREEGVEPMQVLRELWEELAEISVRERDLIPPLVYELINPDPTRARAAFERLPLSRILLGQLQDVPGLRQDLSLDRIASSLTDAFLMTTLRWTAYQQERDVHSDLRSALTLLLDGAFAR
jgi:AcrR family transcriptional regulator